MTIPFELTQKIDDNEYTVRVYDVIKDDNIIKFLVWNSQKQEWEYRPSTNFRPAYSSKTQEIQSIFFDIMNAIERNRNHDGVIREIFFKNKKRKKEYKSGGAYSICD